MAEDTPSPIPDRGEAELENKPDFPRDAKPWNKMIEHATRAFDSYHTICDGIEKDYSDAKRLASSMGEREFQMLYANMEVVKPSIYSRPPQPVVVPRFKDRKPVPRKTSEMLERALVTSFDTEHVHDTLLKVRDDLALFGRGVPWCRYETYQKGDETKECVRYDWIYRRDFLHEPARVWSEVGWVARGSWLTMEQGEKRFGKAWKDVAYIDASDTAEDYKVEQKARVWEIWSKTDNLVVWIHPNSGEVLDIAEPHLNLDGFFPCPKPAIGTCTPGTLIPVPDACFYKDQLEEINELTARISSLSESLKLVGFYAAGQEDLGDAIETALKLAEKDNRRIAVPLAGMSQFGQGALKDAIVWLPIDQVANTVKELVALRKQLIDDVYQISGISDIMRGDTQASETLGAQQLKSQYGSIRIKDRQSELVRVCDGILNIAGEIMSENFAPQTLLSMSQTDELPSQDDVIAQHDQLMNQEIAQAVQQLEQAVAQGQPPPTRQQIEQAKLALQQKHQQEISEVVTIEKVFGLLRSERVRPFVLQIATDSTIQPDENAEKQARNEFGAAFAQATTALAPLVQTAPAESADFVGEMLKFMMAPYRAGRPMEQAIDDFVESMKQRAKQPPPPSPEQIKAESEAKARDLDFKAKEMDVTDRAEERKAKQAERAMLADKAAQEAAHKRDEALAMAADKASERKHKETMAEGEKTLKAMDLRLKEIDLDLKRLETGIRQLEADAKVEEVGDRKEERKFTAAQKTEKDAEDYRAKKVANDSAEMDLEDRREDRGIKRKKSMQDDEKASRDSQEAASRAQQMQRLDAMMAQLADMNQRVMGEVAALQKTMAAPKRVVRDPKTGRAVGVEVVTNGAA